MSSTVAAMLVIVWHARRAANPTILQKVYVLTESADEALIVD